MNKIRKYFGGVEMTWPRVIIFAVITAVYTALINQVSFLKDTSFQDIAINFECWILFAVFIIMNCRTWWEASLKCFVFFLISQPLIYLIEVPFYSRGWAIFDYYGPWFKLTLLTLPGAAVAFLVKKKNWLSALVLSAATGFLGYLFIYYLRITVTNFPYHLLSTLFCLALAVFLIFVLLDKKSHRIAALAITAAVILVYGAYNAKELLDAPKSIYLDEGEWTYTVEDESVVKVEMTGDDSARISPKQKGNTYIHFTNTDGDVIEYYASVSNGALFLDQLE